MVRPPPPTSLRCSRRKEIGWPEQPREPVKGFGRHTTGSAKLAGVSDASLTLLRRCPRPGCRSITTTIRRIYGNSTCPISQAEGGY